MHKKIKQRQLKIFQERISPIYSKINCGKNSVQSNKCFRPTPMEAQNPGEHKTQHCIQSWLTANKRPIQCQESCTI